MVDKAQKTPHSKTSESLSKLEGMESIIDLFLIGKVVTMGLEKDANYCGQSTGYARCLFCSAGLSPLCRSSGRQIVKRGLRDGCKGQG